MKHLYVLDNTGTGYRFTCNVTLTTGTGATEEDALLDLFAELWLAAAQAPGAESGHDVELSRPLTPDLIDFEAHVYASLERRVPARGVAA